MNKINNEKLNINYGTSQYSQCFDKIARIICIRHVYGQNPQIKDYRDIILVIIILSIYIHIFSQTEYTSL